MFAKFSSLGLCLQLFSPSYSYSGNSHAYITCFYCLALIGWSRGTNLAQAVSIRVLSWLVGIQIQRLLEWNKINMAIGVCVSFLWAGKGRKQAHRVKNTALNSQKQGGKSGLVSGSSLQLKPSWSLLKEMENLAHTTLNNSGHPTGHETPWNPQNKYPFCA